jgi:hypothetical protein
MFILSSIYLSSVRPNVKMSPEPPCLLPVTAWIIVSYSLGNIVQLFSYCTFSSYLPFAVLLCYYMIQGPGFYSDFLGT